MAFSRSFLLAAMSALGVNHGEALRATGERPGPQPPRIKTSGPVPKSGVKLRSLIRVCPGGAHGIFQTNAGPVRKPFTAETITWTPEGTVVA